MKRRPRRTIPAILTGLVLLTTCVLIAIVGIQLIIGQTPLIRYRSVTDALHSTQWNDTATLGAGAAAVLLGLLMLLAALLPGSRPSCRWPATWMQASQGAACATPCRAPPGVSTGSAERS